VLNYFGLFFIVIFTIIVLILIASDIGTGVLDKVLPSFHK